MSLVDIKRQARQDVHKTFAVPCDYRDTPSAAPTRLAARLHTRIVVGGDAGPQFATIIEGVTRVIFSRDELSAKSIAPRRNAQVTFPDYGKTYALDIRDPSSGPVTEKWSLAGSGSGSGS